ncbi:MAG TPA: ATP-binding protein [Gemmatimonadaceae bacterium]|nr:ATP-binding protein [Gemmatimonadaceae bacterium]
MITLDLSERVDALDDQRADDDGMTPSSATPVVPPRDTAEDAQARFAFLAESSRCLADSLDYETTLATVARLALPQFGTWCIVDVIEPDGTIRRLSVIHPDRRKQRLARRLHLRHPPMSTDLIGAPRVIRTGRTEIDVDVSDAELIRTSRDAEHLLILRTLGTKSFMIVPLIARGQTLGAITFLNADGDRRYGTTDIVLAEDLARRGAMAIDNARLHRTAETARASAEAARAIAEEALAESQSTRDALTTLNAALESRTAELKLHDRVLQSMAEGVSISNASGTIVYTNPAEDNMFGFLPGELLGKSATMQHPFPPAQERRVGLAPSDHQEERRGWVGEWENVRKDGTTFSSRARMSALELAGERYWVCVQRDVTEEKRVDAMRLEAIELQERARTALEDAYRTVEAASRAKSEFLAVMGHELRTPLNAIGGYAELLEMGLRGPVTAAQMKDLGRIRLAQERLVGIIDDVLNFVRIETGRVEYDLTNVKIHPALLSLETMIAPQVQASRLNYTYVRCDRDVTVLADRGKLDQVLLNLLTNALKFTKPGGGITLSCEADGETVAVRVTDTGVGIAPERMDEIFSPFVQVDRRAARENNGIGLGLAISRDLALGMGGTLTAESTLGVGSTFLLTLPRVA